jgi:hypothetical protein
VSLMIRRQETDDGSRFHACRAVTLQRHLLCHFFFLTFFSFCLSWECYPSLLSFCLLSLLLFFDRYLDHHDHLGTL